MLTKNTKQYELIMTTKTDAQSMANAAKAARAIQRRMLRQQNELWLTQTDVMVLNKVAEILRLGTYRNPFNGGAAFKVTKMAVIPTTLKSWLS